MSPHGDIIKVARHEALVRSGWDGRSGRPKRRSFQTVRRGREASSSETASVEFVALVSFSGR